MTCPKGQIRRSSYKRKSYSRKGGITVKASRVKSTCIKDVGKPGKGPKTLPQPDKNNLLSRFGYKLKKNKNERQKSLKEASKKYGILPVLRRTNLIANLSKWNKDNEKKLKDDVK